MWFPKAATLTQSSYTPVVVLIKQARELFMVKFQSRSPKGLGEESTSPKATG